MTLGIVGSRTFRNYDLLKTFILENYNIKEITLIVSGGANGADRLGERFAYEFNIPVEVIRPDWNRYGKRAGFIRNGDIVAKADQVVAFWDGESRGTNHTIKLCKLNEVPVRIYTFIR